MNRLKFLSLAWVTALCCLQPVKADEAPPAMNTRAAINIAELSQKASTGDTAAQVALANAYFYGEGATEDNQKAYEWYKQAALKNNAFAQYSLGLIYNMGFGRPQDYKQALYWYGKASNQGSGLAKVRLAGLYHEGNGVAKNEDMAKLLYSDGFDALMKDAQNDIPRAQREIASMYYHGMGIKQDKKAAAQWYHKAAELGNAYAQQEYGEMLEDGIGVPADPVEAFKWYQLAANQGRAESQYYVGTAYYNGKGVTQDYEKAFEWFMRSAQKNDRDGQFIVSLMYYKGQGVVKDEKQGLSWLIKAANQDQARAQLTLGALYLTGDGVPENPNKAYEWFAKSAQNGNKQAANMLADSKVLKDQEAREYDAKIRGYHVIKKPVSAIYNYYLTYNLYNFRGKHIRSYEVPVPLNTTTLAQCQNLAANRQLLKKAKALLDDNLWVELEIMRFKVTGACTKVEIQ